MRSIRAGQQYGDERDRTGKAILDTGAIGRLATTLADLAQRGVPVDKRDYFELRQQIFDLVGVDPLLEPLFPTAPQTHSGTSNVWKGAELLGVVAAYLRALSTEAPRSGRLAAATDLMEQAQRLFEDDAVTVVAPIVVAGAALEEVLRDLVEAGELAVSGKPGLATYAQALRTGSVISPDDVKELVSLAAVRNDAAHGKTDLLSRERAGLFLDRVNLFLRQLSMR